LYAELESEQALEVYADHPVHEASVPAPFPSFSRLARLTSSTVAHRYKAKTKPFTTDPPLSPHPALSH
ncbi:hypothetical protein JCM1841_002879, partial [Sporobolomyces salmonicolor]